MTTKRELLVPQCLPESFLPVSSTALARTNFAFNRYAYLRQEDVDLALLASKPNPATFLNFNLSGTAKATERESLGF
jgi:hypothetical protein